MLYCFNKLHIIKKEPKPISFDSLGNSKLFLLLTNYKFRVRINVTGVNRLKNGLAPKIRLENNRLTFEREGGYFFAFISPLIISLNTKSINRIHINSAMQSPPSFRGVG
nr:MAG TPA: hypothetical protein [Caudoviricetes sp.]